MTYTMPDWHPVAAEKTSSGIWRVCALFGILLFIAGAVVSARQYELGASMVVAGLIAFGICGIAHSYSVKSIRVERLG